MPTFRPWRVTARNLDHAMRLIEMAAEDSLRRFETDVILVFAARDEVPYADDMERVKGEQRETIRVFLAQLRQELEAR